MEENRDSKSSTIDYSGQISKITPTKNKIIESIIMAALGSIPWVGGLLTAIANYKLDESDEKRDDLQSKWLKEHTKKIQTLQDSLEYIIGRLENIGVEVNKRISSEDYLDIVRKAFRVWDKADTQEKRKFVADLLTNASASNLSSDDVLRLFIEWLDKFSEFHLAVIREIYKYPGCTRADIWESIYGEFPREDSAEADLFKMLIRDLTLGGVIRQSRETTEDGQFIRKRSHMTSKHAQSSTMESAFEDSKKYVLTSLGKQFVHYTMTELVPRFEDGSG